jgi:hypothetical protein
MTNSNVPTKINRFIAPPQLRNWSSHTRKCGVRSSASKTQRMQSSAFELRRVDVDDLDF